MSRDLARQASQRARIAEQESKREWSAYTRAAKDAFRETEKAAQANQRSINKFAERTSHRATRFFMPNMPIMSMARRASAEMLQGMGVDASISGLMRRGVGIETGAVDLSNRGHIEGAPGPNGQVVAPKLLEAQARAAGKATAVNPEEILAAGHAFVGLTGDLDLWRKIMPQVVAQTKALGGSQEEAAQMAGEFAAHVGDVPNKEKAVLDLLRAAGGQGKIGGVDSSDFAKYAAKVAAPAAQFEGDKAKNIGELTSLAEIAKMHGGASSAAEAFTSIASLTATLKKPARLKSIAALLGNKNGQFADDEHTTLRKPQELIKAMVVAASKGNKDGKSSLDKLAAAIGDTRSLKAVSGVQNTFNEAGGGQKGLDAMTAELNKFNGAIMSNEEIARGLAAALNTSASKAELFNQKLEVITDGVKEKFLPALEKLEGPALRLASTLGNLATSAAEHPWGAVAAAAGFALSRAILESGVRAAIETSITRSLAGTGINVGTASARIGTASMAVGALTWAWKEANDLGQSVGAKSRATDVLTPGAKDGGEFSWGQAAADALSAASGGLLGYAANKGGGVVGDYLTNGYKTLTGTAKPGQQKPGELNPRMALPFRADQYDPEQRSPELNARGGNGPTVQLAELKTQMAGVHTAIKDLHAAIKGGIPVTVTNQEQPKAPVAGPQGGR